MPAYVTAEEVRQFTSSYISSVFRYANKAYDVRLSRVRDKDGFLFRPMDMFTDSDYSGKNAYRIIFDSPTTYKVRHTKAEMWTDLLVGSGDIASDLYVDGLTIPAGTFGGSINAGDEVGFSIEGFISEDALNSVIDDAENEVDNFVKSLRILFYDLSEDHVPMFTQILPLVNNYDPNLPTPIFEEVKLATKKWATAFLIERKLLPVTVGKDISDGFSQTLKNSARKGLTQLCERYKQGRIAARTAPSSAFVTPCGSRLNDVYRSKYCKPKSCGC